MGDILSSLSTAITIVKQLREIGKNIKDAEFMNLIADLSLELAEAKQRLAGVIEENIELKKRIQDLSDFEGEPCPRCHKRAWQIVDSKPDPIFGDLGGINRTYQCSVCGFSEHKLITPD